MAPICIVSVLFFIHELFLITDVLVQNAKLQMRVAQNPRMGGIHGAPAGLIPNQRLNVAIPPPQPPPPPPPPPYPGPPPPYPGSAPQQQQQQQQQVSERRSGHKGGGLHVSFFFRSGRGDFLCLMLV